jgi:Subtilase family
MPEPLDHLLISGYTEGRDFRSTWRVVTHAPPQRERGAHGQRLLGQIAALRVSAEQIAQRRAELQLPEGDGMSIALEISPRGAIDYFKKLEWRTAGIEILSAVDAGGTEVVSLHVPAGGLSAFEKRVRDYLTKDVSRDPNKPSKPANATLVNAIENFRRAAFAELWTDDERAPPDGPAPEWMQVWLRVGARRPSEVREAFALAAQRFGITLDEGYVSFPGRAVVAARSTRAALEQALELLDLVAEIRGVAPNAQFFLADQTPREQADWIRDLLARSQFPDERTSPYVTLLDTGIQYGHPLLAPVLAQADLHAIDATWGATDHHGHGTGMAGLVCHGDLAAALSSNEPHDVPHRLESVKILPPSGVNPPHLYGWVTAQAANIVESAQPQRRRTFAMMTTAMGKTAGLPSEWSATIDQMSFGLDGLNPYPLGSALPEPTQAPLKPRLFVLSAGNVPWQHWQDYPTVNDTSTIEDPGQSWNALTVGACTQLTEIDREQWPSFRPIAAPGLLSPSSTTSMLWRRSWPFKPDVVAEGGNGSLDQHRAPPVSVGPESLRLLTTARDFTHSAFAESGDTSAAAADVARICAHLKARYPEYWPETIRALVIQGARFTSAMRAQLPVVALKKHKDALLRRYGYGKANLEVSLSSSLRQPTLVLQRTIAPYVRRDGSTQLNQLMLHALPWPVEQLQALGGATVALRVTLSYFVEPNPSRRGWQSKFRYQSHGLRFAVKGSVETDDRFLQRINKLERDELAPEEQESMNDPDREHWFLGAQLRARGSIHSDVWVGTGAQLAEKSHVAVFPVGGWWKDWNESQRHSIEVRYALVVTLEVLDDVEVDLYTPIANQIVIATEIGAAPGA